MSPGYDWKAVVIMNTKTEISLSSELGFPHSSDMFHNIYKKIGVDTDSQWTCFNHFFQHGYEAQATPERHDAPGPVSRSLADIVLRCGSGKSLLIN